MGEDVCILQHGEVALLVLELAVVLIVDDTGGDVVTERRQNC